MTWQQLCGVGVQSRPSLGLRWMLTDRVLSLRGICSTRFFMFLWFSRARSSSPSLNRPEQGPSSSGSASASPSGGWWYRLPLGEGPPRSETLSKLPVDPPMHILHMGRSWASPPALPALPAATPPPPPPPPPVKLWNWELRHRLISFRLSTRPLAALAVPLPWPDPDPGLAQLEGLSCPVPVFSPSSFLPPLSTPCSSRLTVSGL